MKLFIIYRRKTYPWQIDEGTTIGNLKEKLRERFQLDPQKNITLCHGGANLEGPWIIRDIGIPYGGSVHLKLRESEPLPNLHIKYNYSGEIIDLYDIDLNKLKVFELQEIVMWRTGLPLGCFRLTDATNNELYPKHTCQYYRILTGANIIVQIWKGWAKLINAVNSGNILEVEDNLDEDKSISFYQMKVVTFMASHHGLLELAEAMLHNGVRGDEPVGYHPGRKWCSDVSDPTLHLYAVHAATEMGKLEVLRLLINRFPYCLIVQNYKRENAQIIAERCKHDDCLTHVNTQRQLKHQKAIPALVGNPKDDDFEYRNYLLVMRLRQWQTLGKERVQLLSAKGSDGSLSTKALDNRRSMVLSSKSDKSFHIDGMIHYRSRTCPAKLAERPNSGLSERKGMTTRAWTPSAKSRRMKTEVLNRGLHWDINTRQSNKIEFTDLLFTPNKTVPNFPNIEREKNSSNVQPQTDSREKCISRKDSKRKIKAIEDKQTGMWVHNGLTAREKAIACLDMASSYESKNWMSKFKIAMTVNECTLKRKLKEGSPQAPIMRNEDGKAYKEQFYRNKPKTKSSNFVARWSNTVDVKDEAEKKKSAVFRKKGIAAVKLSNRLQASA